MEEMLAPALTPAQSESFLNQMSQALGTKLRDQTSGHALPWEVFQAESGLAAPPGAVDLFTTDLASATTPEEVRAALVSVVPQIDSVDMAQRVSKWVHQVTGNPTNPSGLDETGHMVVAQFQTLNAAAVNACIMQKVSWSWWAIALFAAACMIVTFPAWWLGLAFAGVAVAGWLLVILLNCLISAG